MGRAIHRKSPVSRRLRLEPQEEGILRDLTTYGPTFWFTAVQGFIAAAAYGAVIKGHRKNREDWGEKLARAVWQTFPKDGPAYDGNMRFALSMGLILLGWYARLHRAKAMDPNRPLDARRQAYTAWLRSAQAAMMLWVDERDDAKKMGQKWNNPWWPGAKGGKFV
jgi:hypothetical protein